MADLSPLSPSVQVKVLWSTIAALLLWENLNINNVGLLTALRDDSS